MTPFLRCCCCALVAGLTAVAAPADDHRGWYVEGFFGETSLDTTLGRTHLKFFDDDASTAGAEVGYAINRYVAVQAGFHDLGEFTGSGALCPDGAEICPQSFIERLIAEFPGIDPEILLLCVEGTRCDLVAIPLTAELEAWTLSVVPRWPINDRFALRGRLGIAAWEASVTAPFFGPLDLFEGDDLFGALGLEAALTPALTAIVEATSADYDAELVSVGLRWHVR